MKRLMIIVIMLVAVLFSVAGCLFWLPMHSQRPGTNREALGTTDSVAQDAPLIAIARLGSFDDIEALRLSAPYRSLCEKEPALADIDHAMVDLGKEGDWWYVRPLTEHLSMTISEYTWEMFNGEQDERDGQILLRTEETEPILIRISTYDPGSVQIQIVANDGRTLHWIPTETPTEGELRLPPEVVVER